MLSQPCLQCMSSAACNEGRKVEKINKWYKHDITWQGGDKRKTRCGGGGAFIRGRQSFQIFQREAINQGTAIIPGK